MTRFVMNLTSFNDATDLFSTTPGGPAASGRRLPPSITDDRSEPIAEVARGDAPISIAGRARLRCRLDAAAGGR